jgi:hypothetical protein
MAKGADWTVDWRFTEEELREGAERQITDNWRFNCAQCGGQGVSQNRPCEPCGGDGFIWRDDRAPVVILIRAGSKPGTKVRVRGWGYHGDPDTPENRGDRLIRLCLFGDGEIRDELPSSSPSKERNESQSLPPTRPLRNRLTGDR